MSWNDATKQYKIKGFNMSLMSTKVIRDMAVCEINTPCLYEKGVPRPGGVNDLRLGTVERRLRCATCSNDIINCTAHTGFFKLAKPVYHVAYLNHILKILRSLCPNCFRLTIPYTSDIISHLPLDPKERFSAITAHVKARKTCAWQGCSAQLFKYSLTGLIIRKFDQEGTAIPFAPCDAKAMFRLMCPRTLEILGIPNPQDFIIDTLLIPPPIIRPTITYSESTRTRGQDDLTGKLNEIIKMSAKLEERTTNTRKRRRGDDRSIVDPFDSLQLSVACYIDNDVRGARTHTKKRTGLPDKCLVMRWKGKRGRVRAHMMGKRVDFSSRTVISPDPCMDMDEIGIPFEIAKKLTFRERVTENNLPQLQAMVDLGPDHLQGAAGVLNAAGTRVRASHAVKLRTGWEVERYMRDGDWVMFNRQPSLRKQSLMAHRVKLKPGKTFGMSLSCTGAYNGDFDGDEMNVHLPQSEEARAELSGLMSVESQILNAQNNKPIFAIVQDALVGSWLMTADDVWFTRQEVQQLSMSVLYPCKEIPDACKVEAGVGYWSGKQAWSLVLPDMTLKFQDLEIERGLVVKGRLKKRHLGAVSGGVIHTICKLFGNRRAVEFMSDCQRIVYAYMEGRGFSIGLEDCRHRRAPIAEYIAHVDRVHNLGKSLGLDEVEAHTSAMLAKVLDLAGGVAQQSMSPDNALWAMCESGSKGNPINISQIVSCVGQQSVAGRRIIDLTDPSLRTVSSTDPDHDRVVDKGFVASSYYTGLTCKEMYFHTMGGREGIVDTSVKTADTGYMQRRITKGLEGVVIEYDGTVRTSGFVVDLCYGADGCDAAQLECVPMPWLLERVEGTDPESVNLRALMAEALKCKLSAINQRLVLHANLPVNVALLIAQCPAAEHCGDTWPQTKKLLDELAALPGTLWLRTSLAWHLRGVKLKREDVDKVMAQVKNMCDRACVEPGEMVGVLAASSVGEPTTQLTLRTFHVAGVASKNVTLGIPRLKELIDARRNIKSALTRVHLRAEFSCFGSEFVRPVAERMVYTTLEDILLSTNLVFEPDVHTCAFDHEVDSFLVKAQRFIMPVAPDGLSSYVIRFEFDRPHLERLQLHIDDLRHILMDYMQAGSHCLVQCSIRNMKTWVVRLRMGDMQREHRRFKTEHERQEFDKNMAFALTQHLAELHISGIANITAASVEDVLITDPVTFKQATESVIWLNGSNLLAIWSQPMVDWSRTYSNDLFETMDVLGVEATTVLLFHEIKSVLSFDGTYTDDRHIMMVANIMMRHGFVMPLNRHGLNNLSTVTPLTRCSFEKTADVLFDAGAFREPNPLRCVSDNIAMGQRIPGGTGKFHVYTDPDYLKKPKLSRPVLFVTTTFNKSLVGPLKPAPVYIPQSPVYAPQSPEYNPQSPEYNPQSPEYNPQSPQCEPQQFNPLDIKTVAKITTSANEDSVQAGRSMRFEASNGIGRPVKYRPSSPHIRFRCSSPDFNPTPHMPNFSNVMKLFELHQ